MKGYTLYFYSESGSCILYFGIDGRSKVRVLKMGRAMAKLIMDYYKADDMPWLTKVTVKGEDYNPISHD